MGNGNNTSFKVLGVEFSGPTWLAVIVLLALLVIGIIKFVDKGNKALNAGQVIPKPTQVESAETQDENTPINISTIPEE